MAQPIGQRGMKSMKNSLIFAGIVTFASALGAGSAAAADGPNALGPATQAFLTASQSSAAGDAGHVVRHDPSGAPMCFDASGQKAPLAACDDQIAADGDPLAAEGLGGAEGLGFEYITAFDPSGAPMCFDLAGNKAPLSACRSEGASASAGTAFPGQGLAAR